MSAPALADTQPDADQEDEATIRQRTTPPPTRFTAFGGITLPTPFLDEQEARELQEQTNYIFPAFDDALGSWRDLKSRMENTRAFRIGGHYQVVRQDANRSIKEPDYASGGLLRVLGTWTPSGPNQPRAPRLSFTVDHRHGFSSVPPSGMSGQIGYAGSSSVIMGDTKWDLVSLFWNQPFKSCDGLCGFAAGRLDPNEFFYVYSFSTPWAGFMNNEVVNVTALPQPQSSWGAVTGNYFTDTVYAIAGVSDANGTADDDLEWFKDGSEFFTAVEIGWVPDRKTRLDKKASLTVWHVDERETRGIDDAWGFNLSASWLAGDWNPFMRLGWSQGEAPTYNKNVLAGFRKKMRNGADWFGFATSWGDSAKGLGEQISTEIFYSYYLARHLALTADFQYIKNPLNNPVHDSVSLVAFRLRMTF
ncbi:MAG: carbohydrate porin [Pseudomonadota bacterium]